MQDQDFSLIDDSIIVFRTREGYVFKAMNEFFHSSLRVLIFRVTSQGIKMRADNSKDEEPESIMVDLNIPNHHFEIVHVPKSLQDDSESEILLPIDASNFRSATQGILKKDLLTFYVSKDQPKELQILIENREKGRNEEHSVALIDTEILKTRDINPVMPCSYSIDCPRAVGVASEFQKVCKTANSAKVKTVRVIGKEKGLMVIIDNGGTVKRFKYGVYRDSDETIYERRFLVKGNLASIAKCCPMSKTVRFYYEGNKSLLISLSTGQFGILDVYLVPYIDKE